MATPSGKKLKCKVISTKPPSTIMTPSPELQTQGGIIFGSITLGGVLIAVILHLVRKDEGTDFFGYPVQTPILGGGGIANGLRMAGGDCSGLEHEYINVSFPKPNLMAYLKLNSFLLFISNLIFGITVKSDYIIVSIVILLISTAFFIIKKEMSLTSGMNILSLLMYDKISLAKYSAIIGYCLFYTTFSGIISKTVEEPGFLMFMINFILFCGFSTYSSIYENRSMFSVISIVFAVLIVIVNISFGSVIINKLIKSLQDKNTIPGLNKLADDVNKQTGKPK